MIGLEARAQLDRRSAQALTPSAIMLGTSQPCGLERSTLPRKADAVSRKWVVTLCLLQVLAQLCCGQHADILQWLGSLGLGSYEPALLSAGVSSVDQAISLTTDDLKQLGMNMKERKKFLQAISSLSDAQVDNHTSATKGDRAAEAHEDARDKWSTRRTLDSDRCHFDTVSADAISPAEFESQYWRKAPLRITNLTTSLKWSAIEAWQKGPLLSKYGDRKLTLHSQLASSALMGKEKRVTLSEYVDSFRQRQAPKGDDDDNVQSALDKTGEYAFDLKFIERSAPELRNDFSEIPLFSKIAAESASNPSPVLTLGPAEKGFWFHRHGEAWNVLV